MEYSNQNKSINTSEAPTSSPHSPDKKHNIILIITLCIAILLLLIYTMQIQKSSPLQKNSIKPRDVSPNPSITLPQNTLFQNILSKNCLNEPPNSASGEGEILLDVLPLRININDLKSSKGNCSTGFYNNYITVKLEERDSFLTISDKLSNFCCHGGSPIDPLGKMVKENGEIKVYIHTGQWSEGPNSDYKPIIVRGIKDITLENGEIIRVALDRKALRENNTALQKIEEKYKVIDSLFNSGLRVFTPETEEKLLMDNFFTNVSTWTVARKVENDLQTVVPKK